MSAMNEENSSHPSTGEHALSNAYARGKCTNRPTLDAWITEYDSIEQEWMDALRSRGIRFAPRNRDAEAIRDVRRRLKEKGARFMNGGASVSAGRISSACKACTGDSGSQTFFLSLACNRDCYFCFNRNQADYEQSIPLKRGWRDEVGEFLNGDVAPTHAGLTGGEPLLFKDESVEFFKTIHDAAPDVHMRLYTAGDFLDDETAVNLANAGLQELRLSVKLDGGVTSDSEGESSDDAAIADAIEKLKIAKAVIPDVMVEMPVIPGTESSMRKLLRAMDEIGVFGINLLEFCYPYTDWDEYEKRGFAVKNPAFDVLFDYGYAGGLPIAGSELACLELVELAIDEGLQMGVHYCSLDNKNRDQILQLNSKCPIESRIYMRDEGDRFIKTLKVFDGDVTLAKKALRDAGKAFIEDVDDGSLATHPTNVELLVGCMPAISFNVAQPCGEGWALRELKLDVVVD